MQCAKGLPWEQGFDFVKCKGGKGREKASKLQTPPAGSEIDLLLRRQIPHCLKISPVAVELQHPVTECIMLQVLKDIVSPNDTTHCAFSNAGKG